MNPNPEQPDALTRVEVYDGKYTVVLNRDGKLHALRYGEFWRDLTGDKLILALAHEVEELRGSETRKALHAAGWDAARVFENMAELMKCVEAYNEHTPYSEMSKFLAQLKLKRDTAGGGETPKASPMSRIYLMSSRKQWHHSLDNSWKEVAWERFDYVECGIFEKPSTELTEEDRDLIKSHGKEPEGWIKPNA